MPQHDAKDAPSSAPPEPPRATACATRSATAMLGFLLTGVVGTMVATWFQQRGWAWQSRVMQVEKDTSSALDSLRSASDLLDKRWSATFQMVQAIENIQRKGTRRRRSGTTFLSVNNEWELQYANVDATVEFNVDRPFGVDAKRIARRLVFVRCNAFPFDAAAADAIDPKSAHTVLTVINNCQGIVKDELE